MKINSLAKSAVALIILTMISKVLGFGREVVIAYLFGATIMTDAYLMALSIPTLLFSGVGSAIRNVFIPVFDRFRAQKREKTLLSRFLFIGSILVLVVFVIPAFVFAPQLVGIFALGFDENAAQLTVSMVRILCVMMLFRFFSSVIRSVLHVNRNFVIPGMDGLPYNFLIITVSFIFYRQLGIYALVWGTLFGVIAQPFFKLPWMLKIKMNGSWTGQYSDGIKEILRLLPPIIIGSAAGQIKVMTDKMFASTLAEGSISYLNYAVRLIGLPQSLLITAVSTVVYPSLVSYITHGEHDKFKATFTKAVNSMQFLLMPMVIGFMVLPSPIIQAVYQRGNFDAADVVQTVMPLRFYSIGLMGTMLNTFAIRATYAMRDTKTPLFSTGIALLANVILNFLFIGTLKHGGLALGTSLAQWIGGIWLVWLLARKIGGIQVRPMLVDAGKSLAAAIVMGVMVHFAYMAGISLIPAGRIYEMILLAAVICIGALIYFGAAALLRAQGAVEARDMFTRVWRYVFKRRPVE